MLTGGGRHWVLTASHCTLKAGGPARYRVVLGEWDRGTRCAPARLAVNVIKVWIM